MRGESKAVSTLRSATALQIQYEEGLRDTEGFSHIYVLWVFDRSEGYELLGQLPTASRPHGVFATRWPRRPNPIGLTSCRR